MSLTNWSSRAIDLLAPIVEAQSQHVRASRVVAIDETPMRPGANGEIRQAYFWPNLGEDDGGLPLRGLRARRTITCRASWPDFAGTLLSDGYDVRARFRRSTTR